MENAKENQSRGIRKRSVLPPHAPFGRDRLGPGPLLDSPDSGEKRPKGNGVTKLAGPWVSGLAFPLRSLETRSDERCQSHRTLVGVSRNSGITSRVAFSDLSSGGSAHTLDQNKPTAGGKTRIPRRDPRSRQCPTRVASFRGPERLKTVLQSACPRRGSEWGDRSGRGKPRPGGRPCADRSSRRGRPGSRGVP